MNTGALGALMIAFAACAGAPRSAGPASLEARASATLGAMQTRDPGLEDLLDDAYGYAVFPEIARASGTGADQPGGELGSIPVHGRGVLFEHGRPSGHVSLDQDAIGGQLEGLTFAELVVFRHRKDVDRLKAGQLQLATDTSALAVMPGASSAVDGNFPEGIAVFTMAREELVAELPIRGQKLNYQPRG
jgi:hypothetical protein